VIEPDCAICEKFKVCQCHDDDECQDFQVAQFYLDYLDDDARYARRYSQ